MMILYEFNNSIEGIKIFLANWDKTNHSRTKPFVDKVHEDIRIALSFLNKIGIDKDNDHIYSSENYLHSAFLRFNAMDWKEGAIISGRSLYKLFLIMGKYEEAYRIWLYIYKLRYKIKNSNIVSFENLYIERTPIVHQMLHFGDYKLSTKERYNEASHIIEHIKEHNGKSTQNFLYADLIKAICLLRHPPHYSDVIRLLNQAQELLILNAWNLQIWDVVISSYRDLLSRIERKPENLSAEIALIVNKNIYKNINVCDFSIMEEFHRIWSKALGNMDKDNKSIEVYESIKKMTKNIKIPSVYKCVGK
ncbi:MAG: hypothetical protein K8S23_10855 [Candidatus Cloacimonetes bacterium]|nr:hypothetical protein [Candidatus Cloacimonadota bacterium]